MSAKYKQDTEQRILDEAKIIFVKKGLMGARMQEIADAASINKAMLHYYFKSKQELFDRILLGYVNIMAPKLIGALTKEGSIIEKFENLVDAYTDTILKFPQIPSFLLNEMSQGHDTMALHIKERIHKDNTIGNLFIQIIEEQEKGILNKMPPAQMVLNLMSLVIFPFIARPIFMNVFTLTEEDYTKMILNRRELIKENLRLSMLNKIKRKN